MKIEQREKLLKQITFYICIVLLFFLNTGRAQVFPGGGSGSYTLNYPANTFANHIYAPIGDGKYGNIKKGPNYVGALETHAWWSGALWSHSYEAHSDAMYPYPYSMELVTSGLDVPTGITRDVSGTIIRQRITDVNGLADEYRAGTAVEDFIVGAWQEVTSETSVDGHGDMHAIFYQDYGSGNGIRITATQGNPYVFFENIGTITPAIEGLNKIVSATSSSSNSFTIRVQPDGLPERFLGVFFPAGTQVGDDNLNYQDITTLNTGAYGTGMDEMTFNMPVGNRYWSVALLPDGSQGTLDLFETHAFSFVSNTKHSYVYDETNSLLTTSFSTETSNPYGGGDNGTLQALYPHQWDYSPEAQSASNTGLTYLSPRGEMQLVQGNTFTTEMTHFGILPIFGNANTGNDPYLISLIDSYLATQPINPANPYAAPADGYAVGNLRELGNIAQMCDNMGYDVGRDLALDIMEERLTRWLEAPPGDDWCLYQYDPQFNWLTHYPNAFTSSGEFIDQHFHLSYIVYGSAILARYRTAWANDYKEMVEVVIRQINDDQKNATDPGANGTTEPWFPYMRFFDPYAGHSWADPSATNQESVSECLLFAIGTFLWGETIGNDDMRDLGALLYITESEAARRYWYDMEETTTLNWPNGTGTYPQHHTTILRADGGSFATFFTSDNRNKYTITLLPETTGSLYLGWTPGGAENLWNHIVADAGGGYAGFDEHGEHMAYVQGAFDGASAVDAWDNFAVSEEWINPTFPHVNGDVTFLYTWIHTFDSVGTYQNQVQADITGFGVFERDTCDTWYRHYMLYNPPGDPVKTVHMTDGTCWELPQDTVITYALIGPDRVGDLSVNETEICQGETFNLTFTNFSVCDKDTAFVIQSSTDMGTTWTDEYRINSGGDSLTFPIENATAGETWYRAVMLNEYNYIPEMVCDLNDTSRVESSFAKINIRNSDVTITTQPSLLDTILCPTESFTLSVGHAGTGVSYQWQKDGVDLVGETADNYTHAGVVDQSTDGGYYSVTLTGNCGFIKSDSVQIFIGKETTIVQNLSTDTLTLCAGEDLDLGIEVSGDSLVYNWTSPNAETSTTDSLNIGNVQQANQGDYQVEVEGLCGTVNTEVLPVKVNSEVTITTQPSLLDTVLCSSEGFTLSVGYTGTGVSYQWQKDGIDLVGQTADNYTHTGVVDQLTDGGYYGVILTGSCGFIKSDSVQIFVGEQTTIVQNLSTDTLTLCAGEDLDLGIEVTGDSLVYNWTSPNGETSATDSLKIGNVQQANQGDYQVEVVGLCGTVNTELLPVKVNNEVIITTHPSLLDTILCSSEGFTLSVGHTGTGVSYQWQKDGVDLIGQTSDNYTHTGVVDQTTDGGHYSVTLTGNCGFIKSDSVQIFVGEQTTIVQNLSTDTLTLCAGEDLNLGIEVSGDSLVYSWTSPNGETSTTDSLNIGNVQQANQGNYQVEVVGLCGTVNTEVLPVKVNSEVTITTQPILSDTTFCAGENFVLDVLISQNDGVLYQWFKDGSEIVAENNSSLIRTDISKLDSGTYEVSVFGACDTLTSQSITVIVHDSTSITSQPLGDTKCPSGNMIFDVQTVGDSLSYSWFKDSLELSELTSTFIIDPIVSSDSGNYWVEVSGVCGKEISEVATLSVSDTQTPTVTLTADSDTICTGTDVLFTAVGMQNGINPMYEFRELNNPSNVLQTTSLSNSFTTINVTSSIELEVVMTSNVSCSSTSGSSIITTDSISIVVVDPIIASAGNDQVTCDNEVTLNGNFSDFGQWACSNGSLEDENSESTKLLNLPSATPVTCIWQITDGVCPSSSDTVVLTRNDQVTNPEIFLDNVNLTNGEVDICISDVVELTGATLQNSSTETALWESQGRSVSGVTGSSVDQGILTLIDSGSTRIIYNIISSVEGCDTLSSTLDITVHNLPVSQILSISSRDTCEGIDINVVTAEKGSTDVITWTGISPTGGQVNWIIPSEQLQSGDNYISYEVNNLGCPAVISLDTITILSEVIASINLTSAGDLCEDDSVLYVADYENGGTQPIFEWTYSEDTSFNKVSSSDSLLISGLKTSSGIITVIMYNNDLCVNSPVGATTNLNVVSEPFPYILTADTSICIDVPLTIVGGDTVSGTTSYQWYLNGINEVGSLDELSLNDVSVSGAYTLMADNAICEPVVSDPVNITIDTLPEVEIIMGSRVGTDVVGGVDEELSLSGSHTGDSWVWVSNTSEIEITNPDDLLTTYFGREVLVDFISLISYKGTCIATDSVKVQIIAPIELHAPNVFTPNGDGEHEVFEIDGVENYPNSTVSIYNRWGIMVYQTKDYQSNPWDALEVPDGVYFFIVNLDSSNSKGHSGVIHVLR